MVALWLWWWTRDNGVHDFVLIFLVRAFETFVSGVKDEKFWLARDFILVARLSGSSVTAVDPSLHEVNEVERPGKRKCESITAGSQPDLSQSLVTLFESPFGI